MMINDAEAMMSDTVDGWYGLNETNPELYDKINDAISELKAQLETKGYDFEEMVRPHIGF